MWVVFSYASWVISAVLVAWMVFDWIKTDSAHSEQQLTSSREGEIEALSEKHDVSGVRS
jgi:hypothetical protein